MCDEAEFSAMLSLVQVRPNSDATVQLSAVEAKGTLRHPEFRCHRRIDSGKPDRDMAARLQTQLEVALGD